jgi:hypothetical protein
MKGGKTDRHAREGPDSLHHHAVKTANVLAEPFPEARGKAIEAEPALTECMDSTWEVYEEVRARRILTDDLHSVADLCVGAHDLAAYFRRATVRRTKTADDV